jgi:phenylacetate-CoA ligase
VRGLASLPWGLWRRVLRMGGRQVAIDATGGHFLAETFLQHRFRQRPIRRRFARLLSVMTPLDELVDELNAFGPAFLGSYPSVLDLLAREQAAGRLDIAPAVVTSGGEHLSALVRARLMRQWDCPVWDSYNATEAMPLTSACARGCFHVNADWMILEPVDADRRPVPPGTLSVTTLVTNLTNHVQPIIRYELGDSVTLSADRCRCGSPLPVVTVVGRSNDLLRFPRREGAPVEIPPLALGSVIEQTVVVRRYQAIQTGPASLTVRLETEGGSDPDRVWVDLTTTTASGFSDQTWSVVWATSIWVATGPGPNPNRTAESSGRSFAHSTAESSS